MNADDKDILLSQLADGEMETDRANKCLLDVLDDADARERLKEHLQLRLALAPWRSRRPETTLIAAGDAGRQANRAPAWRRIMPLAAAAVIGAMLVVSGFLVARRPGPKAVATTVVAARVTPEQMHRIAEVFDLHESVAGPLEWYAAGERNVRLASASPTERVRRPVAILLRLAPASGGSTPPGSYVVVCRDGGSAEVELPESIDGGSGLRLRLMPSAEDGRIRLRYAVAVTDGEFPAVLAGTRTLGLERTTLGQLALGEKLMNVEASAWTLAAERTR